MFHSQEQVTEEIHMAVIDLAGELTDRIWEPVKEPTQQTGFEGRVWGRVGCKASRAGQNILVFVLKQGAWPRGKVCGLSLKIEGGSCDRGQRSY